MAFVPTDIAGNLCWLTADAIAVADGAAISAWPDSGPSGANGAEPLGSAFRPIHRATGWTGSRHSAQFDGSQDYQAIAGLSGSQKPFTDFYVVRTTSLAAVQTLCAPSAVGGILINIQATTGQIFVSKHGSVTMGQSTANVPVNTDVCISVSYSSAGVWTIRINGKAAGSGTNNQTFTSSLTTLIGSLSGGSQTFVGHWRHSLRYNTDLSLANKQAVEFYLMANSGIVSAVGGLVSPASETDTARPITRLGVINVAVTKATETDTARPITARKTKAIGQATETDTAQTIQVQGAPMVVNSHSYGAGSGATIPATQGFAPLISAALALPLINHSVNESQIVYSGTPPSTPGFDPGGVGVPGKNTAWWIWNQYKATDTAPFASREGPAFVYMGVNDMTFSVTAIPIALTAKELKSVIARFRLGAYFEDNHASVSYGAGWSSNAYTQINSGSTIRGAVPTPGNITINLDTAYGGVGAFPGGTVDAFFVALDTASGAGKGADYTATVDGVSMGGTFDGHGAANATGGGLYRRLVFRIPNVPAGAHTVVLTPTNVVTSTYFDGHGAEFADCPETIVFPPLRLTATGLANHGGHYTNANVDTMRAAFAAVVAEFDYKVALVDLTFLDANAAYMAADEVHPANNGHQYIADQGVATYNAMQVITATATQASETDTARPATSRKTLAAGRPGETDTAQPIRAIRTYPLARAAESDAAQPVAHSKQLAVAHASETDTADPVPPARVYPLTPAGESDTAQVVEVAKTLAVNHASETDTAEPVAPRRTYPVAPAGETDAGQPVEVAKSVPVAQALETDAAQPVAGGRAFPVGIASETDSATTVTWSKVHPVGIAAETDSARPFSEPGQLTVPVVQAAETDSATPVLSAKAKTVAPAAETDEANPVRPHHVVPVGQATETDTAQPASGHKTYPVGRAGEIDTAQPVAKPDSETTGQATEADTAMAVTVRRTIPVGTATETSTAEPFTVRRTYPLHRATETDTGRPVAGRHTAPIGQATDTETANPVAAGRTHPIGIAAETGTGLPFKYHRHIAVRQAAETDTAGRTFGGQVIGVGHATETDAAQIIYHRRQTGGRAVPTGRHTGPTTGRVERPQTGRVS